MKQIKYFFFALILLASTISMQTNAFAIPCDTGGVSGSVDCQNGADNNDKIPGNVAVTVNDENFFGFSNWIYLQKDEEGSIDTNINAGWTITPEDGSWADDAGTWSFLSSVWDTFTDVMIVVKGGNHKGVFFSGYLLDNVLEPTSGTWDTGGRDVSHLTLYAREGDNPPIPEPTTIILLGSGLIGLACFRRKLKK